MDSQPGTSGIGASSFYNQKKRAYKPQNIEQSLATSDVEDIEDHVVNELDEAVALSEEDSLKEMSLGKIILKSTTKISLNDRFTVLRNEKPSVNNGHFDPTEESRQIIQASRRNQRLAAQMERRPAVMAALKSKKNLQNRLNGQQQSISVKQRLALPGRIRVPDSYRGSFRGPRRGQVNIRVRGVRNKFLGRISTDNRPPTAFRGRGRAQQFGVGSQRGRGGPRGRGRGRGRGFPRGRSSSRIFR